MNWYRLAQDTKRIYQIAFKVRQAILNTTDDDILKAQCLPASRQLAHILIQNGFAAAHVVRGTFTVDNPDMDAYSEWDWKDFLPSEPMDSEDEEREYAERAMEEATHYPLHYWVQISDIVVDITGDQFNDELDGGGFPPVFVGQLSSEPRYTVHQEDYIQPRIMY